MWPMQQFITLGIGVLVAALAVACGGGSSGSDATSPVNRPPSVTFFAPAEATVGAPITLTATANDSDGSVAQVEFFDGAQLLGSASNAPFSITWTPAAGGTRSLTARATDNLSAQSTSNAVAVDVMPDTQSPVAVLTSPSALADHLTGAVTLVATATDNVGVLGVAFEVDGVAVGTELSAAPYQITIDTAQFTAGQHVVRARARDGAGNVSPWSSAMVRFDSAARVPQGFTLDDTWVTGLTLATSFAQTPDGRLLVAEQGGTVRVIRNGVLQIAPFASVGVDSVDERGLLGIAVHPNFAFNGYVYLYYTSPTGGSHNRISRFVASAANADVSTGVETVLVDLPKLGPATVHNGGGMLFGLDGKLYVGIGENTVATKAQDLSDPFGKLLRFNDDGSIPSDNPFYATQSGLARAIWAYGLRNPFTVAIQPGTGRIHINDVGANTWEEINVAARGANYGWPQSEGPDNIVAGITGPLYAYKHDDAVPPGSGPGGFFVGDVIAGGTFYPASGPFPVAYRGNYYFSDFGTGVIGRLDLNSGSAAYAFAKPAASALGLLAGNDGALYLLGQSVVQRITAP
jgi:glucose/arabinose dehydrogenase